MSEDPQDRPRSGTLAPPDPPLPVKTWRGTLLIAVSALAFLSILGLVMFRWADLQTFSDELRFEGYHRFSGIWLPPLPVAGSDLLKFRVRTDDGEELIFPAVPDLPGESSFTRRPEGACVEGYALHRRGYLAEMNLVIDDAGYYLDQDAGWILSGEKERSGAP